MKAIQVKYLSVTNTKPARLKVWAEGNKPLIINRDSIGYDSAKSVEQMAAEQFAHNLKWLDYDNWNECERVLAGGQLPNGDHCFVITLNKVK